MNPMDPMYSEAVWARFRSPAHAGRLHGPQVTTVRMQTPGSRAVLQLQLSVAGTGPTAQVQQARFLAYGGVASIAAADWLAEYVSGKAVVEVQGLAVNQLMEALSLPVVKRHSALLACNALQAALAQTTGSVQ